MTLNNHLPNIFRATAEHQALSDVATGATCCCHTTTNPTPGHAVKTGFAPRIAHRRGLSLVNNFRIAWVLIWTSAVRTCPSEPALAGAWGTSRHHKQTKEVSSPSRPIHGWSGRMLTRNKDKTK